MVLPYQVRQLNIVAILALLSMLVLYSGAVVGLFLREIDYPTFFATVGTPTGALIGWLAKSYTVQAPPQ